MKNKTFTISIIIIVILSIMLFFTVYHITDEQQKAKWENNEVKMEEIQNQESPAQEYVDLEGLPENYEVEKAVQDGCMVIGNEVYNVEKLEEGRYYIVDMLGLEVYSDEQVLLGTLEDIFNTGSNDIYVVKNKEGKQILLPAIQDVIKQIDMENKKIIVHLLPGLI